MRPIHPNMRSSRGAPDSNWRPLVEAQAEQKSASKKTRAELQTADTFVARAHDFPAGNILDAHLETCELTLANAPAANHFYEAHYSVAIEVVIPGAGTAFHNVVVAIETDILGNGVWVEQWRSAPYDVTTKVGEPDRVVRWDSQHLTARVPGLTSASKLRLRIIEVTLPGGATFQVHGFNAATDGDPKINGAANPQPIPGVTYHTGPVVDFMENGGGVELADVRVTKLSHGAHTTFETDLGGRFPDPAAAPYLVARTVWGSDDSNDIAIDRFTAFLHPKENAGSDKEVAMWACQPIALVAP